MTDFLELRCILVEKLRMLLTVMKMHDTKYILFIYTNDLAFKSFYIILAC